jgi:hypothetical protein
MHEMLSMEPGPWEKLGDVIIKLWLHSMPGTAQSELWTEFMVPKVSKWLNRKIFKLSSAIAMTVFNHGGNKNKDLWQNMEK